MAPVYDFRHVELDKIGRGKRIVKPPGGECSDIFSPKNGVAEQLMTPRKTKNYMQSNIFSPDSPDAPNHNGHVTPTRTLDTQSRLFGSPPEETTPRRIINRQRSSIFEEEGTDSRPRSTPVRRPSINPITGEGLFENGAANGYHNGHNGHSNGGTPNGLTPNGGTPNGGTPNGGTPNGHTNGYSNGHSSPESPMNGYGRVRNPPGGKSSGIF